MKETTTKKQISGFLKLPEVLAIFPVSTATWYRGIKSGIYPKGIKLNKRSSAWRVEDIENLIKNIGRD